MQPVEAAPDQPGQRHDIAKDRHGPMASARCGSKRHSTIPKIRKPR
jgi:hypothetical protein